jgi:hypothetical protein
VHRSLVHSTKIFSQLEEFSCVVMHCSNVDMPYRRVCTEIKKAVQCCMQYCICVWSELLEHTSGNCGSMPERESVVESFKIVGCVIVSRYDFKKSERLSVLNSVSHDVLRVWQSVHKCVGTYAVWVFMLKKLCFFLLYINICHFPLLTFIGPSSAFPVDTKFCENWSVGSKIGMGHTQTAWWSYQTISPQHRKVG